MLLIGCASVICFDPSLKLYDLSRYEHVPDVLGTEQLLSVSPRIDVEKISLTVSDGSSTAGAIDDLVRRATQHILAMGFLGAKEEDERVVDSLVTRRLTEVANRPFTQDL